MKIAFSTLGCKLNFAETSHIGKTLIDKGFEKCTTNEEADIVIINTCSVTDVADKKGRQAIRKMIHLHPNAYIVVTGCYAQLKPEEIATIDGVDLILGANEKVDIPNLLENIQIKKSQHANTQVVSTQNIKSFIPISSSDDRTRHFIKVQDGCNYYCTYCTIPYARGNSRNASIADTIKVIKNTIEKGAREIVLTGVNTGDFGRSTNESFFDLIKEIDKIDANVRYRISSIEPNLLTNEIIEFVAHSKHFAPHFHIPLQSGSDSILKLMHRRYDTKLFADKITFIKNIMPNAFIGVDLMVGVRGETEELFNESKTFVASLPISQLHVFTYSERNGTKALEITPIVPMNIRKQRNTIIQKISDEKHNNFYLSQKGNNATVLWEESKDKNTMHGFTENYVRIEKPYNKELINTFQNIIID